MKNRRCSELFGDRTKAKFRFRRVGNVEFDVGETITLREDDPATFRHEDGTLDAGGLDVSVGLCGNFGCPLGGQYSCQCEKEKECIAGAHVVECTATRSLKST